MTIVTSTANLTAEDLAGARGRIVKKFSIDGVDIFAFRIPYSQKMGRLLRCLAWIAFLFVSVVFALFKRNIDVVYARSTPLTIGIPAMMARWFRRIPFVFEVTDQWPEIPIEMGVIRNRFIIRLLLWLEKTIYRYSSAIVACSPGMANGVREVMKKNGLKDKPIAMIPNFSETNIYGPHVDGSGVRKEFGWGDKLVFLHAGTMGTANSLDFVIDVAERLRDKPDILFVLVGEGRQKPDLQSRVEKLGLSNIEIRPAVRKQDLPEVLAACDVAIIIFANYPILEHNSANKFFDSISGGKPILLNYSGWQREIIEENKAGFGCSLCDQDEFVEKAVYLNSHRDELAEMGRNSRKIAEESFDRDKLASQVLLALENVSSQKSGWK